MVADDRDVRIVLVRARNPLNIGAAARAMSNFGFADLQLVSTHEPVWQETRSAPGAEALLERACAFPDLPPAIADRTLVLGTSALSRRSAALPAIPLDRLSDFLQERPQQDRLAILFGSEKSGLRNEELSYCQAVIRIPTAAQCPSMNLGQAVAVCCYELRRALDSAHPTAAGQRPHATVGEVTRLVGEIEKLLGREESSSTQRQDTRVARLRELLLQWPVTSQDVSQMLGLVRDIAWHVKNKRTAT
ncbi:MAG: RNA methyltransferase [Acidobacteria bacterium]|nr:RNA methyltransferase [Acidobacteriota bacterium]